MRIRNPHFLGKPWFGYVVLIAFMLLGAHVWSANTARKAADRAAHAAAKQAATVAAAKATSVANRIAAIQLRNGCGRTQRTNAYLRLRAQEFKVGDSSPSLTTEIAPQIFPLVWCERSFRQGYDGPPVFLDRTTSLCFISLVRHGYFNVSTGHQPFTDPSRLLRLCRKL